jgi:hypothetical protein
MPARELIVANCLTGVEEARRRTPSPFETSNEGRSILPHGVAARAS